VLKRIFNIFRAFMSLFISKMEDPEVMLQEELHQFDVAIEKANSSFDQNIARAELLKQDIAESEKNIVHYTDLARRANGKDQQLALDSAARVSKETDHLAFLNGELANINEINGRFQETIDDLRDKRNRHATEVANLKMKHNIAQSQKTMNKALSDVGGLSTDTTFARMKEKVELDHAESMAAAKRIDVQSGNDMERRARQLDKGSAQETLDKILGNNHAEA
jgi:phage shock protein A